jgi:PKD repeat protein
MRNLAWGFENGTGIVTDSDGDGYTDAAELLAGSDTHDSESHPSLPGTLQFSQASLSTVENGGDLTVAVSRTTGSLGAVTVDYATSDGTATAGQDYTASSGTLSWADGDTADKTFIVPILDDALSESSETINLTLSNITGGAILGSDSTATVTISDDESVDITTGLISHWKFDNDATDSVGTNHGTLTGTASYIAGGRIDQAVDFTSGAVIIPDHDSLDFAANEEFTFSFWVNGTQTTACMIIDKRDTTGYQFRYDSGTSPLNFMIYEGSGRITVSAPIALVLDGNWHHVAGGRNTSEAFLYVDGTLIGSVPDTTLADLTNNTVDIGIGNYSWGTDGDFTGMMDDIRVYGRALNQLEITALASAAIGNQSPTASLTANPTSGTEPLTVNFDGSASSDSDGTIVSYEWDYDSNNIIDATGAITSYTYNTAGSYTAVLTVTDDQGATDTDTVTITVNPIAPTQYTIQATAGAGGTIAPSGTITLNSGDNQTFTITPNANYHILDVLVDGASVGAAASHTFNNVTANHTIEASFAINTYSLTITAADGSVAKSPDQQVRDLAEPLRLQALSHLTQVLTRHLQ